MLISLIIGKYFTEDILEISSEGFDFTTLHVRWAENDSSLLENFVFTAFLELYAENERLFQSDKIFSLLPPSSHVLREMTECEKIFSGLFEWAVAENICTYFADLVASQGEGKCYVLISRNLLVSQGGVISGGGIPTGFVEYHWLLTC